MCSLVCGGIAQQHREPKFRFTGSLGADAVSTVFRSRLTSLKPKTRTSALLAGTTLVEAFTAMGEISALVSKPDGYLQVQTVSILGD